ncbi:hypothetical protein [Aeromicrobium marinum]|uniref:hypothetical protein n=1 Tax=Aeromicrobium marinum TaxID=219314 RepID=UPI0012EA1941|nr:hypothetical protein [Aeromicrobium marinum]
MRRSERVVVGSTGSGEGLDVEARRLRDTGAEVVWIGAGVSVDDLAATAVAEDAARVVVASGDDPTAVTAALAARHVDDVDVITAAG